jgi:hypothetical protein
MVSKKTHVKSMSDEQWNELVEVWKNPNKMVCCLYIPKFFLVHGDLHMHSNLFSMQATCEKNKANQDKVMFHQTTGSHSYMLHCENLVRHLFLRYIAATIRKYVTCGIFVVFRERSTMVNVLMVSICSRSATTTRKRKATHLLYNLLLYVVWYPLSGIVCLFHH